MNQQNVFYITLIVLHMRPRKFGVFFSVRKDRLESIVIVSTTACSRCLKFSKIVAKLVFKTIYTYSSVGERENENFKCKKCKKYDQT